MYLQVLKRTIKKTIIGSLISILMVSGIFNTPLSFANASSKNNITSNTPPAQSVPLQVFPLDNYNQNLDDWFSPSAQDYQKPLVDMAYQKKRLEEFYQHSLSSDADGLSPWSQHFVSDQLNACPTLFTRQSELIKKFDNEGKPANSIGYGLNFRPYDKTWIDHIAENMNIDQFKEPIQYRAFNRAIFVQNTYARALPTQEPFLYHYSLPGEGYPFDQLQMSSIWAGSSAYIVGVSKDRNWSFVLTPDFNGWVQSETLAKVDAQFINHWQRAAKNKLAAVTQTEAPVRDSQNKHYHLKAYVGTVFPLLGEKDENYQVLIPTRDAKGFAQVKKALINTNHAAVMPLVANPENFVKLMKTLQNRPYGWGGLHFLNDCSAELKSLYTPFGFWLPRHSSEQIKVGKMIDKSQVSPKEKIAYLKEKGRPFMTFVYNTKHVFIYLGNFSNPNAPNNEIVPLTYQNLWALKPLDASRRAVVGKALILPLLETFPEDKELNSHANHKEFQVISLDEWPE